MKTRQLRIGSHRRPCCVRCGGLMVADRSVDWTGWRCVICGDLIDPFILQHRYQRTVETIRTPTPQRKSAATLRSQ